MSSAAIAVLCGSLAATLGARAAVDNRSFAVSMPASIAYGSTGWVTTHATSGGVGIAGVQVSLNAATSATAALQTVAHATTSSSGVVRFHIGPHMNTLYSVTWVIETQTSGFAHRTLPQWVNVRQVLTITPSTYTVRQGHELTVYGTVAPNESGQYVYLEDRVGTSWRLSGIKAVLTKQTLPNGVTTVGYLMRFPLPASYLRTYRPATSQNAAGTSRTIVVSLAIPVT